ncbi:MAG: glycosyltransferase family 4 protein [Chloroflexota bacterium]
MTSSPPAAPIQRPPTAAAGVGELESAPGPAPAGGPHALLLDFSFFPYTVSLANALVDLCPVTLLLPEPAARRYHPGLDPRVRLYSFPKYRLRSPLNLLAVARIYRLIRQARPAVVHQLAWNLWFNASLPVFPHLPLVTTIHDVQPHPGDRDAIPLFWAGQWRRAGQVIVHSAGLRRQLIDRDPSTAGKIHVIPHGAYDFYTRWQQPAQAEVFPSVLYFGRIWEYKGLRYLVQAEPLISREFPDLRIVIAGTGEPIEKYTALMAHPERFELLNHYIPDEQVALLFQQASLVALPYLEASQSGVLAIAGAFGKPVVASAVGGIGEVLQHGVNGLLVPPGDAAGLAGAVLSLLRDEPLRRRLGQALLEQSQQAYAWPAIARQVQQVYQRALHPSAAPLEDPCAS